MTTKAEFHKAFQAAADAGFQFIPSDDFSDLIAVGPDEKRLEYAEPILKHKSSLLKHLKNARMFDGRENPKPPKEHRHVIQRQQSVPQPIGQQAIKAIATTYRQYEFRSRLEAKWAAFFDLCKWPWSYEPVDYNGWIPDFAIGDRPTLVEIKPFFKIEEWSDAIKKICASGCTQRVILLGSDPVWIANNCESYTSAPVISWSFDSWSSSEPVTDTFDLHFGVTEGNNKLGLCANDGPWRNLVWDFPKHPAQGSDGGGTDKWGRVHLSYSNQEKELVERWATACNISKWVPTRNGNNA